MKAAQNPPRRPDLIAAIKTAAAADPAAAFQVAGYAEELRKESHNLVGPCPFHDDRTPSFNITIAGPKAGLFKCFGCDEGGSIIDFYLKLNGRGPKPTRQDLDELAGKLQIEAEPRRWEQPLATYDYQAEDGTLLYQAVKFPGKHFNFRQPGKREGEWEWNLKGVTRVLYQLPLLLADPAALVIVCEGEKDADRVNDLASAPWDAGPGPVATTNPGGAGKWREEYAELLREREVVIVPDNDAAGRKHGEKVAASLAGVARSVKVVLLPDLPEKGDVSDYLDAGHTLDDLRALAAQTPPWEPSAQPAAEEARAAGTDERPRLHAGENRLEIISAQGWDAILTANSPPRLFLHGGRPARFEVDSDEAAALHTLTIARLRHELARAAYWWKIGDHGEAPALPPKVVVEDMLAYPLEKLTLPPVDRIVRAPAFATDGALQVASGYHPAGRIIVRLSKDLQVPAIPTAPTDHHIEEAVAFIDDLIADFPFVNGADRAAAFALLLLPFVRDMIDGPTPLHLIEAPTAGTGKGLLAAVALIPAAGDDLGMMTQCRTEDEWRKQITTRLREAKAALLIDNVTHRLESGALSAALTAWPRWGDRLLGTLDPLSLPVRCAWVATGNNPALSTEIARRSIRCRLDAKIDRPFQRDPATFRHPALREWARDHRTELLGAALTLAQAWLAAGRPAAAVRPLGSYESWTRVIGGILAHAGIEHFLDNLDDLYERADSEGAAWRRFVQAWWDEYQDRAVGVADLHPIALDLEDFDLGKGDEERRQRMVLGHSLARRADTVLGGFRIEAAGTKQRAMMWRLTPTQTPPLPGLRADPPEQSELL